MKTIFHSIIITVLVAFMLGCAFVIMGLILNFWNEDMFSAGLAFVSSLIFGTIAFFGLTELISHHKDYINKY